MTDRSIVARKTFGMCDRFFRGKVEPGLAASDLHPGLGVNVSELPASLPPKESIREIRINQNPFSPEFDKLGLGRIEILTKPGADQWRGNLNYNFATDAWNSRNPYSAIKAPLGLNEYKMR